MSPRPGYDKPIRFEDRPVIWCRLSVLVQYNKIEGDLLLNPPLSYSAVKVRCLCRNRQNNQNSQQRTDGRKSLILLVLVDFG